MQPPNDAAQCNGARISPEGRGAKSVSFRWELPMIRCLVCLCACVMSGAIFAEELPALPTEPASMQVLFNGKDLTGWDGDPRLWSVQDGVIHGETTETNAATRRRTGNV